MNKKGAMHIEIILAFILFVGFLIFGLYFFSPINTKRVLDSTLTYATDEIITNTTSDLTTYSVLLPPIATDNVRVYYNLLDEKKANLSESEQVKIIDNVGKTITYVRAKTNVLVHTGKSKDPKFIKIIIGDFEDQGGSSGGTILDLKEGYTISSSNTQKVVSELRLLALNKTYKKDYVGLKKAFNLPSRVDFDFIVRFSDGREIESSIGAPQSVEVTSQRKRMEVIKTDGTVDFADFIIRVW